MIIKELFNNDKEKFRVRVIICLVVVSRFGHSIQIKQSLQKQVFILKKIRLMQLKYNPQQTTTSSTQAVYTQYKKWLQQNGVIVDPRVRYPSYFGEKSKGVIGVSASKPIQKNKAIIAVPYKLLITMDKVLDDKVLSKIINENPDVFGISEHAVMKMLILYVCSQLLKGKESFYFTYFEIGKYSYLQKWTHWEMMALQNKELMRALKLQKQQVEICFLEFLRLFMKYGNVFPQGKGNIFYQKLFERAYTFVTTRAFGWSLPSISLIPMADSLNHGNNYLNHYLVDKQEQKNPSATYQVHKDKSNLSLLKEQHLIPSENQLVELRKKKKRRYQKFIQKHKEIITSSKDLGDLGNNSKVQSSQRNKQYFILSQQYKSEVRNLRQLHFYESSCSQDNDTDEDELTDFTIKREQFEFDEKYRSNAKMTQNSKKSTVSKYWKLWTDNTLDEDEEDSQNQEEEKRKKDQTKQMKETLQNYKEKHKQSQGSSEVSSTESSEDDQNFDWMKSHQVQQHKGCYFVMETRGVIRENEELHNFYGRRTNRFLLQSYNFVMPNNQYDSFGFRLYADPALNLKPNSAQKLIYLGNQKQSTQKSIKSKLTRQIRLKRQQINIELINHCRCYVLQFQKKQFQSPFTITLPFDRQIELKTLKLYKQIIQALKGQYMTDQQDDEQLLEKTVHHQLRTAIQYRIMQKEILQYQVELIDKCVELLTKRWKGGRIEKPTWKDFRDLVKIKSYAIQLERGKVQ